MELGDWKPLLIGYEPLVAVLVEVPMLDALKMNYEVVIAVSVNE